MANALRDVDHCRLHVLVPEQVLGGSNIVAILQEMGGERMAEDVGRGTFGKPRPVHRPFHRPLDDGLIGRCWCHTPPDASSPHPAR